MPRPETRLLAADSMRIIVVGIGCAAPEFISRLSDVFGARITFASLPLLSSAYVEVTGQWSAEKILNGLKQKEFTTDRADKVLGIVDVDIAVKGLNFVFGLSEIGGRNCLISLYRLRSAGGWPRADVLFEERTLKEATHELGHSLGLEHCSDRKCVMSFSNSIEEVDRKGREFCRECTRRLTLL